VLLVCLSVLAVQGSRQKPADWDEEVDGEWEAPKEEDEGFNHLGQGQGYNPPDQPSYPPPPPPEQYLSQEPDAWANSVATTRLWEVISSGDMDGLNAMIKVNPRVIHARAEDGRGPLFWAYEYGRPQMFKLLESQGVDNTVKDKDGMTPPDFAKGSEEL